MMLRLVLLLLKNGLGTFVRMSKFSDTISECIMSANALIEADYIASRKTFNSCPSTETNFFPWADKSSWSVIPNNAIGTYLFYLDNKMVYVGQGIIKNRVEKNYKKFMEYIEKGLRKAPAIKTNEDWVVTPKMYNLCNNIKRWKIKCVIFNTYSPSLNKKYAKQCEDFMIYNYNPLLNCKKGDNT